MILLDVRQNIAFPVFKSDFVRINDVKKENFNQFCLCYSISKYLQAIRPNYLDSLQLNVVYKTHDRRNKNSDS